MKSWETHKKPWYILASFVSLVFFGITVYITALEIVNETETLTRILFHITGCIGWAFMGGVSLKGLYDLCKKTE